MTTRRKFIAAAALMAAAVPLTSSLLLAEAKEEKAKEKVQLMFVQTADDLKADDKALSPSSQICPGKAHRRRL